MSAAPRRERGLLEKLFTIVHGLEVIALAFGALAVWGVTRDWPAPTAFGVVAVVLILTLQLLRFSWGWLASLAAQLLMACLAFVEPVMIGVSLAFIAMWIFCFVRARQILRGQQ
ncbi:DUF4233 domain-containing protein [Agrococcus sp. SGAir0287]|uniref:DUF4233 domain-containing protein n=1 Tax=Agrococcus sp. SGAir0287 TaxID=2070347 RepID=UPI0010CCC6B0|nr:DUF4233 domain-containing protein [Agrococcus sp. SGAir0287]QCR19083.1 hypothetical protein C1N71_06210 [Agrococcus sp. SGAir0287]